MTIGEVHIIKDGEPVLRKVAQEVSATDMTSQRVQEVIQKMSNALATQKFGVAIAAPQIGESLRIFVVAGKVLAKRAGRDKSTEPDQAFINPIILKTSKKMQESQESCLSIQGRPEERGPDVAGIVERPLKMLIEFYNERGVKEQRGTSGFLAAIFDHEIDHLNGILFIDKTIDVWEIDKNFNKVD